MRIDLAMTANVQPIPILGFHPSMTVQHCLAIGLDSEMETG